MIKQNSTARANAKMYITACNGPNTLKASLNLTPKHVILFITY